jgi:hypothetical protein
MSRTLSLPLLSPFLLCALCDLCGAPSEFSRDLIWMTFENLLEMQIIKRENKCQEKDVYNGPQNSDSIICAFLVY